MDPFNKQYTCVQRFELHLSVFSKLPLLGICNFSKKEI